VSEKNRFIAHQKTLGRAGPEVGIIASLSEAAGVAVDEKAEKRLLWQPIAPFAGDRKGEGEEQNYE